VARSLGNYTYDKYSASREQSRPCEVEVFPLAVRRQLKHWPEAQEREARWCSVEEAISIVTETGLRDLLCVLECRKKLDHPQKPQGEARARRR
jgi:hypothetical protein